MLNTYILIIKDKTKIKNIYSLDEEQFTAYSPHPILLNQIFASTKKHLMLFDIRYSNKALLRWDHHQEYYSPTEISIIPVSQINHNFSSGE